MDVTTAVGIVVAVVSLAAGVASLGRYARTRERIWLAVGLLFTLVIPGIVLLGLLCSATRNVDVPFLPPPA